MHDYVRVPGAVLVLESCVLYVCTRVPVRPSPSLLRPSRMLTGGMGREIYPAEKIDIAEERRKNERRKCVVSAVSPERSE